MYLCEQARELPPWRGVDSRFQAGATSPEEKKWIQSSNYFLLRVAKQHFTEHLHYSVFQISFSQQPLISSSPSNFTELKKTEFTVWKGNGVRKVEKTTERERQAQGFVKDSIQHPPWGKSTTAKEEPPEISRWNHSWCRAWSDKRDISQCQGNQFIMVPDLLSSKSNSSNSTQRFQHPRLSNRWNNKKEN